MANPWKILTTVTASSDALFKSNVTLGDSSSDIIKVNGQLTASAGAYITDTSVITVSSADTALRITQTGAGDALRVEDNTNPDSTPFIVKSDGKVGIGIDAPTSNLTVSGSVNIGDRTQAQGSYSHAEGQETVAYALSSHAEGFLTVASASYSHAEGRSTQAIGLFSHAEGSDTISVDNGAHAEGYGTVASGAYSHAEGNETIAYNWISHAEGYVTKAYGEADHAEGDTTVASGGYSHAEGSNTRTEGYASHAEGYGTVASGSYSHTEGRQTLATGLGSHAAGYFSTASGDYGHAEGCATEASGIYSHAEGYVTIASGPGSHAEGYGSIAEGVNSHAEGDYTVASGPRSHAEGILTIAGGYTSHAEGMETQATGWSSHAEGYLTVASGDASHAEGQETLASGAYSHAEGYQTTASGIWSHAIGYRSKAIGNASFAHGYDSVASGAHSVAFGSFNTAKADYSIAFGGGGAEANEVASIAMGVATLATEDSQIALGYANQTASNAIVIVGNGTWTGEFPDRSNIIEIYREKVVISGGLNVVGAVTASNFVGTASYSQDSDKLDGYHASDFARLAANNTFSGINNFQEITGTHAYFAGNITINGTASISHLDTITQQSLVVGDKYIVIMSGGVDHVGLDGAGLLFGSGSTGPTIDENGANAYVRYRNVYDKLEIFPGLRVSGSLTASQASYFTQVTASDGFSGFLYGTSSYALNADQLDGIDSSLFALKTDVTGAINNFPTRVEVSGAITGALASAITITTVRTEYDKLRYVETGSLSTGNAIVSLSKAAFVNANKNFITLDIMVRETANNSWTNDLVSVYMQTGSTYVDVTIDAPGIAGGSWEYKLVAVNENTGTLGLI